MSDTVDSWRRVGFFFALTAAFSAIFWWLIARTGHVAAGHGLYVTGLQWTPGIAGLLTGLRYRRTLSDQGWKWGTTKLTFLGYLIPIAYITRVYVIAWITGLGGFYDHSFLASEKTSFGWSGLSDAGALASYVLTVGTVGMIPSCATALGEEIGWRGFLVPELAKVTSFRRGSLICGLAWAVWHYPLFLFADYGAESPKLLAITCFTITVAASSFVYTWMRLVSGSVWPGMVLHASHNLFLENVFDPLTIRTPTTASVTGEFGIGLAVATVVVALICRRYGSPASRAVRIVRPDAVLGG